MKLAISVCDNLGILLNPSVLFFSGRQWVEKPVKFDSVLKYGFVQYLTNLLDHLLLK